MIDLALLAPDLSEEDVSAGCELARKYRIASVTLRPADVQLAADWLKGSGVIVNAAVSYPHGAATTAVKNYETRDMLNRGAKGIETPVNLGKLLSRRFQYVEMEIMQMVTEARRSGAKVTLDLEMPYLAHDLRIIACKIAKRTEVDRVRVASLMSRDRPTMADLTFLKERLGEWVGVDAGNLVTTLDEAKAVYAAGAIGFQTTDPAPILDAWTAELEERKKAEQASEPPKR